MQTHSTRGAGGVKTFTCLAEFYPFYLSQHQSRINRRLHFAGTAILIALGVTALFQHDLRLLIAMPVAGYGFAWFGHLVFEKNKPATFTYPLYSFVCDFLMFRDILLNRLPRDLVVRSTP
ncbi:MAG TPA: DUF962 domain-containing protein [Steroidobacteraceae bacterium]